MDLLALYGEIGNTWSAGASHDDTIVVEDTATSNRFEIQGITRDGNGAWTLVVMPVE